MLDTSGERAARGRGWTGAGRRYGLAAMLCLAAATPAAHAKEVFKYTDPHGGVEYTDRRDASGREATVIEVPQSPVSDETASSQLEALTKEAEQRRQNRELVAGVREAQAQHKAERLRNCEAARTDLATLAPQHRPQTTDDAGNLVVLDYEAKQRRMAQLRDAIREFCE